MKKIFFMTFILAAAFLLTGQISLAQNNAEAEYDKYIALLRKDLRSDKKQFIAMNMELTDAEATKFWPIFDKYTADQGKLFDTRIALIKEYGANYEKMTNITAARLTQRNIALDQSQTALRLRYVPIVAKALPGKKSALFFQLDKRIGLLIDLQIASEIPLVDQ